MTLRALWHALRGHTVERERHADGWTVRCSCGGVSRYVAVVVDHGAWRETERYDLVSTTCPRAEHDERLWLRSHRRLAAQMLPAARVVR